MENKEIYIDGVNVAGCGYFCEIDKECNICGMGTDGEDTFCRDCKDNSNCYYKQLQRLKQENEELKKFFDSAAKKNTNLENKMKEYREQYDDLYWTSNQLLKDKTKLKQALEEVRDIVMESKPVDEPISASEFTIRQMGLQTNKLIRTLAKINEVLG